MPKTKTSTKKKKSSTKSSEKKNYNPEDIEKEKNRCLKYHGNEDECKEKNCWYYRNRKKCVPHYKKDWNEKQSKKKYKRGSKKSRRGSKKSRRGSKKSRRRSKKSRRKNS